MNVQEMMKLLAHADPNADVTIGPNLRPLTAIHIEDGLPDVIYPFVVLLPLESDTA
jgi:hypothetical protein